MQIRWRRDPAPAASDADAPLETLDADALDALDADTSNTLDADAGPTPAGIRGSHPDAAAEVAEALTEVLPEARAAWLRWEMRRCKLRIFDGRAGPGDPARYRALSAALAEEE